MQNFLYNNKFNLHENELTDKTHFRNSGFTPKLVFQGGGGGGELPYETDGDARVSLRGVNFGFWSRLWCSGQSAIILCRLGLVQGPAKKHRITRRETEVKFSFNFFLDKSI